MANVREGGEAKRRRIFTYGTLKRGFANHSLMQDLIEQNDAVYLGCYWTRLCFPLVLRRYGIPYLINVPGSGRRIRGELYSVSDRGLARIDELEGTSVGHYERLPVEVKVEAEAEAAIGAECYFAGRGLAEELLNGNGGEGLAEYTEREAVQYVTKAQRSK